MNELDKRLVSVRPLARQLALQRMEMYAFWHLTVNTFTGREWGDGTESPALFNPSHFDPRQGARAVKAAGMTGAILTCKHHDGFCLWPSAHTDHSVAASPWRDGKGDAVREAAEACRAYGLRFGVYLSPWDRHSPLYGTGKPYDDYFVAQLTELLTGYGDIFAVWLDGACGEGPNGKKQRYDWERSYETVRRLQPGACIHVCGPDIRWCGNEAGDTRPSEWSVVPRRLMDTEKVASLSQQSDDAAFRQRPLRAQDRDLGSREALRDEPELIWYPAEVNTSIRPGWFWHPEEDDLVKPLSELIRVYEHSVGGNATFLLNIPPTSEGLLHENDVKRLEEFGAYLKDAYGHDLVPEAQVDWQEGEIIARWPSPVAFRRVVLQEDIRLSQRVERFAIDIETAGGWTEVCAGTVIGHKRIVTLPVTTASALRVRIVDCRCEPRLTFMGVYA